MSDRVGKKRSTITNYLRLLRLDPIIQTGMRDGFISMGHGRALVTIESRADQLAVYEKILAKGLSVRATEQLTKENKPTTPKNPPPANPYTESKLNIYKKIFGDKVTIQVNSKGGGQIVVPFSSEKEFQKITKSLQSED
jgi:ParB family chromosome partitioning protein